MKDNLIKKAYISAFDIDDKYLKDLIVINTKCLIDDNTQRYVYVDNNRLRDELIYYRFYGEKPNYNNIINILLPIITSNTNIKKSEDEVVELIQKYVKYFKKEDNLFEYILSSVLYNAIIHYIIEDKNIEYKDLLQKIKERIIEFTISLMLLGKSRGQLLIAPERMKQMGLSRNDAYLWMCLVGSIPKLGRSPGGGNGNPLSTLA